MSSSDSTQATPRGVRYRIGELTLIPWDLTLTRRDRSVPLTRKAVDVLLALQTSHGEPIGREELMKNVWRGVSVDEAALKQYVYTLRGAFRELDPDNEYIETVPRRGYRLTVPLVPDPVIPEGERGNGSAGLGATEQTRRKGLEVRWGVIMALVTLVGVASLAYVGWRALQKRETADVLAREGFVRLRRSNVPDIVEARNRFEQALQLSPDLPLALAGLAEAFARGQNASFDHARNLALESARRDPRCAECRAILGYILMTRDWKWEEAGKELQRAWEISPRDPQTCIWRAQWMIARGKFPQALDQARACLSLDPTRPASFAMLASVLYFSRQYREAVYEADKALGLHHRFQPGFKWRYRAHLLLDEDLKAITSRAQMVNSWSQASEEKMLDVMSAWNQTYRSGRRKAVAEAFLSEVSTGLALDVQRYERAVWRMWIDDLSGALEELEAGIKTRPYDMMFVAVDPIFARLQTVPRFQEVVRQVGLENTEQS